MRYMLFLHNLHYEPKDILWLKTEARNLASNYSIMIRDARVASTHIEYDISMPDDYRIPEVAHILYSIGDYASSYRVVEKKREKMEAIYESTRYFNEEKYWIAHEILESVWKGSSGVEKEITGGIILVCAAFVHYQKNEEEICISILRRALKKLTNAGGKYFNIDVDKIKNGISNIITKNKVELIEI